MARTSVAMQDGCLARLERTSWAPLVVWCEQDRTALRFRTCGGFRSASGSVPGAWWTARRSGSGRRHSPGD